MEKIVITIPDGLTPEKEALLVAKKLASKKLAQSQTLIGEGIEYKSLTTTIEVIRKPKYSDRVVKCKICNALHVFKAGTPIYTNYGGKNKKHAICSKECGDTLIDALGEGRASYKPIIKKIYYE